MPDRNDPADARPPIEIVGLIGGECFGAAARHAIAQATVVVGSARHLEATAGVPPAAARIPLTGALDIAFEAIEHHRSSGGFVTVLASGDPGFFGIARALGERFGRAELRVHPAPSSVSLAFARMGSSWDDAVVVSAHGRALEAAIALLLRAAKAAVFTSPDNPAETVGAALLAHGCGPRHVVVVTRLGEADECVVALPDLEALARGAFDPMSILILTDAEAAPSDVSLAWGLAEEHFAHRAGMITKAEVRAVALGKLALPSSGVLWDIGAGSGSVAIEAARLAPNLRVVAIDHDPESVSRIEKNADAHGVRVETVTGRAPEALAALPDPDRVFIGGGGIAALTAALERLRPGGTVVANYALMDRAVLAWQQLGNMVEISVARGTPVAGAGVRLAAENPVFVCWGPE